MIKKVVDIYYTALMTFLVFTFANHLLQGLIQSFCIDLFLYAIMWLSLVLQTTFAYVHIRKVDFRNYHVKALFSDCLDIAIAIYVCAAIGSTYNENGYCELSNYRHLSIPFLLLAINQFSWFVIVREFNSSAIFRICILFFGMTAITISECICHSFWNLVAVVSLIIILGILKTIDWAPKLFVKVVENMWKYAKKKRICEYCRPPKKSDG